MSDCLRRNTGLSEEDQRACRERDPFFWEDYIGYSHGMCHFRHGSYRLEDIVCAMYPDPDDPRRSMMMLTYSGH